MPIYVIAYATRGSIALGSPYLSACLCAGTGISSDSPAMRMSPEELATADLTSDDCCSSCPHGKLRHYLLGGEDRTVQEWAAKEAFRCGHGPAVLVDADQAYAVYKAARVHPVHFSWWGAQADHLMACGARVYIWDPTPLGYQTWREEDDKITYTFERSNTTCPSCLTALKEKDNAPR